MLRTSIKRACTHKYKHGRPPKAISTLISSPEPKSCIPAGFNKLNAISTVGFRNRRMTLSTLDLYLAKRDLKSDFVRIFAKFVY